jgi:hypothetical protein
MRLRYAVRLLKNVRRPTIFIKGNVDIHDSLHSCRAGGTLVWNGINEILRVSHPGCIARLKHETWSRSDALLSCDGKAPKALQARQLVMGSYPASTQFSRAVFETKADAFIFSMQPDLATAMVRHKKEGFLLYPFDSERWSAEDKQWLKSDFERIGTLDIAQSMANFTLIIEKLREKSDVPILVYNLSPIIPGEMIHCHQGMGEAYSIRKFNLGLIELSEQTGVSIIDVDSLLARKGADALKLDPLHLTAPGYQLVAEEVVRVLGDLGVLEMEEA